ncbi:hypothetical protein L1987_84899 [Smallanthus sonchifolius]|uniref:Uncharacterized protein n=1 Tax=Smallanthus sonchifolius TaxID=185202 RepID=A0ACB8XW76_9ASTR|nr:hypothetical protein L1987_84899 [Smallanthus sonchifolius]
MEIAPHGGVGNLPDSSPASTVSIDNSNSSSNTYDGDDEDEDVCRIGRNPGEADNPLRHPCACNGTIKFVHQDCLLQWLNHSKALQCEESGKLVIQTWYASTPFSPVYAEYALGLFFIRFIFVLSIWLLIIPFITFWIWRFSFVRSYNEAQRLFLSHISTILILTDCLHRFLLSASIAFIFLGATSLRDYFRHLRELGGQEGDREEELDRNGARLARRQGIGTLLVKGMVKMLMR